MQKRYTVAIDLGGTNAKIALIKDEKEILSKEVFSTKDYQGREVLIKQITESVNSLLKDKKVKKTQVKALGIGVPGPVDFEKGVIYQLTNVKGWRDVPLKRILSGKLKLKVYIDNDVNLIALGEYKHGAGKGTKNMICLTLGTGVGGGLILDGRLYRGSNFTAGEVGHIPVNLQGPKCNCGGRGCLERYVGNYYLVERAKELIKGKPNSEILKLAGGRLSKISPEIIDRASKAGDKLALGIWQETGRYIGVALAGLVNVFNPERIVIGGGVALAGEVLFASIRKTVSLRAMEAPARKVKIVPAKLGDEAGLLGASILAAENS
jgi:glucokinase